MSNEFSQKAVGARLKLLRLASKPDNQKIWAETLGAKPQQYNNWERGQAIIPVEYAVKICGRTGANLDYIYLGKTDGITLSLSKELDRLAAAPGNKTDD